MAMVSGKRSSLNPKAEPFIPMSYRQVEDFSPAWWELVKASSWYRDYWLSQHGDDDFGANDWDDAFDYDDDEEEEEEEEEDDMIPEIINDGFMSVDELDGADKRENGESAPKGVVEELWTLDVNVALVLCRFIDIATSLKRGAEMRAEALLKNLSMPKSPKDRAPRSTVVGYPKRCKRSVQNARVKCAPRRIHQPR